jgi:hypothetical protein
MSTHSGTRIGALENPPIWWPHFVGPSFTEFEQAECERYCKKIIENVAAEKGMTPWERWRATVAGEIPDRPMVHMFVDPIGVSRVLDSWSYSLKPGFDLYNFPQMFMKANLAWIARFPADIMNVYTLWGAISMIEWGGNSRAKMMPRMMPSMIEHAVKTEADLEKIHLPDINQDGFLPPSIWTLRKIKEFLKKYDVASVLPLMGYIEFAPYDPAVLMGIKGGLVAIRRDPGLTHKCAEIETQFNINYDKAMQEAGADLTCSSGELGVGGLERAKEYDQYYQRIANAGGPNHMFADSGLGVSVLEFRNKSGSYGPTGWFATADNHPLELQRRLATEYKKVFGVLPFNAPDLTPGHSIQNEEEMLKNTIKVCAGPGFLQTIHLDYWSTPEHLDAFVRVPREYGKELYKGLRK